jgi:hypothetical protein
MTFIEKNNRFFQKNFSATFSFFSKNQKRALDGFGDERRLFQTNRNEAKKFFQHFSNRSFFRRIEIIFQTFLRFLNQADFFEKMKTQNFRKNFFSDLH